jgi:integrase
MRHVDPARSSAAPAAAVRAGAAGALDGASPRDRVGLALGMNTALRAGDIMALKVGDVNLSNNTLHAFIQKTKRYDDLPISVELRAELLRWFEAYAREMGLKDWMTELPNQWTLVPAAHFQAFNVHQPAGGGRNVYKTSGTYSNPETIVHRALERLGHPTRGEGFHTLRRSTARRFFDLAIEEGVRDPIRMPQALLGHARRETTEIYLGITVEKEMRDELLRGKSFLRQVADAEIRNAKGEDERRRAAGE